MLFSTFISTQIILHVYSKCASFSRFSTHYVIIIFRQTGHQIEYVHITTLFEEEYIRLKLTTTNTSAETNTCHCA